MAPFDPAPFEPPRWLAGGHSQTILGGLGIARRRPAPLEADEELRHFRMEDGVELVALCNWLPDRTAHPTVVALHGLTGDARCGYMVGLAEKARAAGMSCVRVNLRGAGDSAESSPSIYNAGVSDDLHAVLSELRSEGLTRLTVVGFSLGGNIALKLAGERRDELRGLADGLIAISPPIELAQCADALDATPMNRLYQWTFLRDLRAKLRALNERRPGCYHVDGLDEVRSLREFDDRFTAPFGGYGNAVNYYETCSAARVLDGVSIPTLVIQARDDSFVPFEPFRDPVFEANPHLRLLATDRGGHNAFFAARPAGGAWPDRGRFWAENRAVEFAAALDREPAG